MDYLLIFHVGSEIRELTLRPGEQATVGEGQDDVLRVDGLGPARLALRSIGEGVHVLARAPLRVDGETATDRVLSVGDVALVTDRVTLAVFEKRCDLKDGLSLAPFHEIRIGRGGKNDIRLMGSQVSASHAILRRGPGGWAIEDLGSRNGTFIDGRRLGAGPVPLQDGASVFAGGSKFSIQGDVLRFINTDEGVELSPMLVDSLIPVSQPRKAHPSFYRSPRIRGSEGPVEVEVSPPPSAGSKPSISWLSVLLPPCMMIAVMLSVAAFTGNRMTLFYTVPMSFVSITVAVANYRSQMKKWREVQELIKKKYGEHLAEKEAEIVAAESARLTALASKDPGVRECLSIAEGLGRRLWERTLRDVDFLSLRLGTGRVPSNVTVKVPKAQLALEEDPYLAQAAELKDRHAALNGVPICHSFLEAPITGLVGSRDAVQKTAWRLMMGVATHHSYEDVRILCVWPERESKQWEWVRWLPHVWDGERTRRFVACTADKARPMLREVAEILKVRRREARERRDAPPDTPFWILILADRSLVEASGETFLPESSSLGFAALYAYGDLGALPGECQAVIDCGDMREGRLGAIQMAATGERVLFRPDRSELRWMDAFARALAPVRLRSVGAAGGMPTYIPLLQGLGVTRVEELNVLDRWARGKPFQSIAAPIGVKENGETFFFDIHEKGMGPHGIAAGATRWGKSETLTTWLLSVALHYQPEEVSFVLIDFKGDGLSGILMDLPHVAGVISNVDDITSIERNLRSLRGELDRRQRVFKETKLENIHKYQETRRQDPDRGLEPMPYLIVVIDEFAQLKLQFPEQMAEFTSIAQVGGSLGVYMVLATQSPGGIVAGQVSANSRFRICLKTAEAGESREILGTTDAFRITVRGRAYVKVGNNEVYEQVQTFYSKAPYRPEAGEKGPVTEIELVDLGGERIRPESWDRTVGASASDLGEGRAISSYILGEAKRGGLPFARPVWTEPLPKSLALDGLIAGREAFRDGVWAERDRGLSVVVGRVDDPEEQCQYPLVLDFMKDGHQVLYGAPSSGKTTFLQTVLLSAALSYTPQQAQFLVMDFGAFGMSLFEGLPHMLMVADAGDKEKVKKAEEWLLSELETRKQLFKPQGVGTLEAYRDVTGEPLPAVLVAVDNMAALYNQYPDTMDALMQVAREGGGLGIYLILTAGNPGSFMFRIAQYVKSSHALQLTDRADYRQLVGGTGRQEPGHFPGRGFTQGPREFQTALGAEGITEGERVKRLRELCVAMSAAWEGPRASMEAASPQVDVEALAFDRDSVQIGLDVKTGEPVDFVFAGMNGCIVSGAEGSGKTNALGLILRALGQDPGTTLYLYEQGTFLEGLCPGAHVAHDGPSSDALLSELAEEYDRRSDEGGDYRDARIVLCIDGFPAFFEGISEDSLTGLDVIIRNGAEQEMYVYISGDEDGLGRLHAFLVRPLESCLARGNAIALGWSLKDHTIFSEFHRHEDVSLPEREGCLICGGNAVHLRLAKASTLVKEEVA